MGPIGRPLVVMTPLAALVFLYTFVPAGLQRDLAYQAIGLLCVTVAFIGLFRSGPRRRTGWLLVLGGYLGWVLGDAVYLVQTSVLEIDTFPGPADVVYLVSYGLIAAGLLFMVRRRGSHGDLAAALDAAILATGIAVVAGVFVIGPMASDSSLSLLGRVTSSAYPIADVLLLGIVARLWTTPAAKSGAFRLLVASLAVTLLGDVVYNVSTVVSGNSISTTGNDVLWLAGYVLIAGAACSRSMQDLTEPLPGHQTLVDPTARMVVLTGGLLLPAVALLIDGVADGEVSWAIIAIGSMALSVLVLSRMAGLLNVVRAQSVQLEALARTDPLTGVPNRRTWDHELTRSCQMARDLDHPLSVALIDLDYFKDYNDEHGHQGGDLLLRELTATWTSLLQPGELLARYGGDEFAVLYTAQNAAMARSRVITLLEHSPSGTSCSAGVAQWDPSEEPSSVVAAADRALYLAKRRGRNQACLEPIAVEQQPPAPAEPPPGFPSAVRPAAADPVPAPAPAPIHMEKPTMVLQPIVDLTTSEPFAAEALSRFMTADPMTVFDEARRNGTGPDLEAAAIRAALAARPEGLLLSVNVGMDALASEPVRDALSGDLTGVIIEVTEHEDIGTESELMRAIESYRARGAIMAVDDYGRGYSNLERVLLIRPEILKIDMSLVHGLDSQFHVATIRAAAQWAASVGAKLCAEGIETVEQLEQLRGLGVALGQGFLFGRPSVPVDRSADVSELTA